jgi:arsenate reductase (thioredoxin)
VTPLNVLILCTGNSARSVLGEALVTHLGAGRLGGYSAGSHPKGEVHPLALEVLAAHGVPAPHARSKSWNEFTLPDAPPIHIVITVCDEAAAEVCPVWPGHPTTAHWGMPDPAAVGGSLDTRRQAFERTFVTLEQRIGRLAALPLHEMDAGQIGPALRIIAEQIRPATL